MAIQLPRVQRNAPIEQASVGRETIKQVDLSPYQAQSKAVEKLVETGGDFVMKEMQNTADTKSTEVKNSYETWYNEKLRGKDGIAYLKGDTTEVYKKFEEDSKKEMERIMSEASDYSEMTKVAIQSKLEAAHVKLNETRIGLQGKQNADYTTRVTNDAIALTRNDMIDATANLDINDKNGTIPIDRVIGNIKDLRYKEGLKNGTVRETTDPNEIDPYTKQPKVIKTEIDPSVKAKTDKDVSDALTLAIDNLSASGDVHGAEFLMKKYESQLNGVQRNKMEKIVTKAVKDSEAKNVVNNIMNLPPEKAQAAIDKIKDFDVRENATKRYDSEMRRRDNITKRASKTNYSAAANVIMERQQQGQPFLDEVQMMDDPKIKRLWNNISDPKQKIALQHMVNQPKDSDQNVKNEAFTKLFNGELRGMSPEDFQEVVGGLNKEDRKMFETQYRKFNAQTPGQETQEVKWMGSQLQKQLQSIGYVKKDQYGKYSNKDQIKLNNAQSELIDALDKFPPNASYKDKQDYIKEFAVKKIKEGGAAPELPKFQGTIKPPMRDVTPKALPKVADASNVGGVPVTQTGLQNKVQAMQQYKAKYGRWPDLKTNELQDFIKKGGK